MVFRCGARARARARSRRAGPGANHTLIETRSGRESNSEPHSKHVTPRAHTGKATGLCVPRRCQQRGNIMDRMGSDGCARPAGCALSTHISTHRGLLSAYRGVLSAHRGVLSARGGCNIDPQGSIICPKGCIIGPPGCIISPQGVYYRFTSKY